MSEMKKKSYYDKSRADRAVAFINMLKHTKGVWHGKPFLLLPWQEKIVRDLFGTVKENGYRQYNYAYIEIPKKQGKSELAAAIALYLMAGDGEWGAEVYGCAADRQQASIVFDVAADMVDQCPALKKRIKPILSHPHPAHGKYPYLFMALCSMYCTGSQIDSYMTLCFTAQATQENSPCFSKLPQQARTEILYAGRCTKRRWIFWKGER